MMTADDDIQTSLGQLWLKSLPVSCHAFLEHWTHHPTDDTPQPRRCRVASKCEKGEGRFTGECQNLSAALVGNPVQRRLWSRRHLRNLTPQDVDNSRDTTDNSGSRSQQSTCGEKGGMEKGLVTWLPTLSSCSIVHDLWRSVEVVSMWTRPLLSNT